jgi:hypothetical protein
MGSDRILEDVGLWNVDRISSSPWWDVDVDVDEEEVDSALSASEREEE